NVQAVILADRRQAEVEEEEKQQYRDAPEKLHVADRQSAQRQRAVQPCQSNRQTNQHRETEAGKTELDRDPGSFGQQPDVAPKAHVGVIVPEQIAAGLGRVVLLEEGGGHQLFLALVPQAILLIDAARLAALENAVQRRIDLGGESLVILAE